MIRTLLRALRLIVSPDKEWRSIREEEPARAVIARFVLPLAVIPAASWGIGLKLFGIGMPGRRDSAAMGIVEIFHSSLIAYLCVVLSICLCAVAIVALAPLFACQRDWQRALQVAAYSAAPVLIGGVVLVLPDLASLLILAFFHSMYLQYAGLKHVLAAKEDDAAEYVALSTVLLMVLSSLMGALGGWLGIL